MESISKIFESDGADFCKSIKVINNGYTAVCMSYGVAYQHDFKSEDDKLGIRSIVITSEAMEASRSKMLHKYSRFVEMLSKRQDSLWTKNTLFIRMGGHHDSALPWPYVPDHRPVTTQDLNNLCKMISKKFPFLIFQLAFVYINKYTTVTIDHRSLDGRVQLFKVDCDTCDNWMGNVESWQHIFDRYNFNIGDMAEKASEVSKNLAAQILHN